MSYFFHSQPLLFCAPPGVGGVQGDRTRRVRAQWINGWAQYFIPTVGVGGAVYTQISEANQAQPAGGVSAPQPFVTLFDNDRVTPTGDANKPRAWGALACCWLGIPAS